MARTFYRKQFSNYLGEQRAVDDIVTFFTADIGPTPSPSPTPSITPSPTATPIISVTTTPTNTPTQTNTPTTTQTQTPTNTSTPTITPTITRTPYAACPEQINVSGNTTPAYNGTYNFYGVGYFDGDGTEQIILGTLTGTSYVVYVKGIGVNTYYIAYTNEIVTNRWRVVNYNGTDTNGLQSSSIISSPYVLPGNGNGQNSSYISYPVVCPSPTPTNTTTNTQTPTNTGTQTPTPTLTSTPTPTPNALCPQQLILSASSPNYLYGLYNRITTYTGGTFETAWYNFDDNVMNFGTNPDGNDYVGFVTNTGVDYTSLYWASDIMGNDGNWSLAYTTGSSLYDGATIINSMVLDPDSIVDGILFFPPSGNLQYNGGYIQYQAICPTPTPTATITNTPTASNTPTVTTTPTNTSTPTPTIPDNINKLQAENSDFIFTENSDQIITEQ